MDENLSLDPIPPLIHLLTRQQKQGYAHRQPAPAYSPDLIGLNLLSQSHWELCENKSPLLKRAAAAAAASTQSVVKGLHPPGGRERKNHHLGFSHGDARGSGTGLLLGLKKGMG